MARRPGLDVRQPGSGPTPSMNVAYVLHYVVM